MALRTGFSTRLRRLLAERRLEDVRVLIRGLSLDSLKYELLHMAPREGLALCSVLRKPLLAELLGDLMPRDLHRLLGAASVTELCGLFLEMPENLLPTLYAALPQSTGKLVLEKLPKKLKKAILSCEIWAEDSVGSVMSDVGVVLSPQETAEEALDHVRAEAASRDHVHMCFVLDGDRFIGTAELEDLVMAAPDTPVAKIADEDCHAVPPEMDRAEAAQLMSRYDVEALPVVSDGRLLGVLPFDDVLDVMQEEDTDLFHHVGGLYGDNERDSLAGEALRRLPCLLLCLVTGILSTGIMERYEELLAQVIALSFFVPLLTGTGGNVGSQILTLIIRELGLGNLDGHYILKVLAREIFTALILGGAMAALAAMRATMLGVGLSVTWVVSLAMIAVVMVSNCTGALLPFAVRRLGLDPALISGPLLATIVDVVGLAVYFAVASFIL